MTPAKIHTVVGAVKKLAENNYGPHHTDGPSSTFQKTANALVVAWAILWTETRYCPSGTHTCALDFIEQPEADLYFGLGYGLRSIEEELRAYGITNPRFVLDEDRLCVAWHLISEMRVEISRYVIQPEIAQIIVADLQTDDSQ